MRGSIVVFGVDLRTLLFGVFGAVILMAGILIMMPVKVSAQASPVPCTGAYNAYNRQDFCGFFNNQGLDGGPDLRGGTWNPDGTWTWANGSDPGVPNSVDTAVEFIDMILSDYYTGDQRARTVAQYMILNMIGVLPTQDQVLAKTVTPEQIVDWQTRVMSYADIDDNSSGSGVSTGQNGSIVWNDYRGLSCGDLNTYYQIEYDDVTAYEVSVDNDPDCVTGDALASNHIVFRDTSDNDIFQIRRLCMNPTGTAFAGIEDAAPENDGVLGDLVFEDVNQNGVFDPGVDRGIPGVTIALYEANAACEQGTLIDTATTDADGRYRFENLPVIGPEGLFANYIVAVTDDNGVLNDFIASVGTPGEDDNSQDPAGYCMTLALEERSNQTGDFGYYRSAANDNGGTNEQGDGTLAATGNAQIWLIIGAALSMIVGAVVLRRYNISKI